MRCHLAEVSNCGRLKVHIQGERAPGKTGFITVHDIGHNHKSFIPFVDHKIMQELAERSVWIHICLPGQEDQAENLPADYRYPSLDEIADDLISLMDQHGVPSVIGFGDGAGANIMYRFGLNYPQRCLGLVLVNCSNNTVNKDGPIFQMKLLSIKRSCEKLFKKVQAGRRTPSYERVHNTNCLNMNNVVKYWNSYNERSDIEKLIKANKMVNVLLVAGHNSKHLEAVRDINSYNVASQIMVILDGANPISDSPAELIQALILFCKGCGVLLDIPMIGLERQFHQVKEHKPPTAIQLQIATKTQRYENLLEDEGQL